jgi:3-methyl-2-oxobutanoate hydroxymethyltransferase
VRLTPRDIFERKANGGKLTVLTAYDYPCAKILDEEGVDIILVGDSLGMVHLGHEDTRSVTMEDMAGHTAAVSRAVKRAMVVADMPFGSYGEPETAIQNARRLTREAGADAVKLEGGEKILEQVSALINAGIPVMGHVGMLPQSVSAAGKYQVQGRTPGEAEAIVRDALLLDRLGAFAIVLECIPQTLGARITKEVRCPAIGIGAGPATDGQVLVLHDFLGYKSKVHPKFVRPYADFDGQMRRAVRAYRSDVQAGNFPSEKESY